MLSLHGRGPGFLGHDLAAAPLSVLSFFCGSLVSHKEIIPLSSSDLSLSLCVTAEQLLPEKVVGLVNFAPFSQGLLKFKCVTYKNIAAICNF